MKADGARMLHAQRAFVVWACVACSPSSVPCMSPSDCGRRSECLAHRCVPLGSLPVDPTIARHLTRAKRVAVWRRSGELLGAPASVTLGGAAHLASSLALDFEPVWEQHHVRSAFLVLQPSSGQQRIPHTLRVEVRANATPWSARAEAAPTTWKSPAAVGIARSSAPLRVDVTELLALWVAHPEHRHGVTVSAQSDGPLGIAFATGAGWEDSPYLEVYGEPLRRTR